jgi:DNA end-binding protein Ku
MASTVWRGYLTFGLVSIPVRLFRAARAERVSLKRLYRAPATSRSFASRQEPEDSSEEDDAVAVPSDEHTEKSREDEPVRPISPVLAPVQQVSVRHGTDEILNREAVVKGYEYEKNRYIAIDKEELKSIEPKTATEMQIEEFVKLAEVDPVYFETSYYVIPEEAGTKAYGLLYRSLQVTQLVAVSKFAMHNREHVVIVRPGRKGLLAHTMYFQSEVRADQEYVAETEGLSAKEMELAETLIHSLVGPFEPEKYRDTYREQLEAIIAKKIEGQPITPIKPLTRTAPVTDITEALQRSLAALKKPPTSERQTERQDTRPQKSTRKRARRAS